jgi:hypothetical protein
MKIMELLLDDAYLSKVVNDKTSWFTQMEVLHHIYYQCFFTTNSLEHQATTVEDLQPLTPQW